MQNKIVKSVMVTLFLLTMIATQAQPKHERKDFTFKTMKVKNAEGEISEVRLQTFVGSLLIKEYTFELNSPVSEEMAESIGTISETDLNFDGYPDVDVYLGYYGGFATNTQQEALLWDQEQHAFVYPDGYAGIGELMLNTEKKYLIHTGSEGPDERVTSYYRWHGSKLQHYLDEVWAIESDDNTSFEGLLNYPLQRYDAQLDGRIPVIIAIQMKDKDLLAGYIYYPKAKTPAPIMIIGNVYHREDGDYYYLNEYQSDGIITGAIMLKHQVGDGWDDKVEGTWTNPKTQKEMKLTDISFSREVPKWFKESLLVPEDPGNIGREYSFRQWHLGAEDYMGGHISFRAAGKNKVHFECVNAAHGIAEGSSEANRPAVLHGNWFEYHDVNECNYSFYAAFFPRFVVLVNTTDNSTLECFGAGASFEGIYIKVKQ